MPSTYTLISSNVLSSSATSVTFSSIPSTYTDLVLRISARSNNAANILANVKMTFNSIAADYSETMIRGSGSAASSFRLSNRDSLIYSYVTGDTATSNTLGSVEYYIPNYAGSQNKVAGSSWATENNATEAYIGATAMLLQNTAAISGITLSAASDQWLSGSSFYLYGISKS